MATFASRAAQFINSPVGPKTIHFWAPTFKWGISIANVADFKRPADQVSYPQQCAVTATGVIWTRFATVINPVNYNLMSVNFFMALTGLYQLGRKLRHDYGQPAGLAAAEPSSTGDKTA
ncbi:putative light-induced protein [Coccomyxa subellipsoidea C-169]|uniref:Mitochondrial pyruvate carrier n=1 Tax=Coccomyxa subellipsoidea (strain C-169) TaxID=574566 RepID=I0YXT4_COCSC|nr:putative light-induced protein [Coccomyxa subellipsoidea C-169]EIE23203.1 putative light-induced protein [Coccomyxa subellipsoidea C-169]|eukprot:XP_005647747.1 putative light-induced protein [Coccomyxa subellipsoidea C-169]